VFLHPQTLLYIQIRFLHQKKCWKIWPNVDLSSCWQHASNFSLGISNFHLVQRLQRGKKFNSNVLMNMLCDKLSSSAQKAGKRLKRRNGHLFYSNNPWKKVNLFYCNCFKFPLHLKFQKGRVR